MKRFLFYSILFMILCIGNLYSQTTVTIGSGTTTSYIIPINVYYSYTYSQQIILQSEIDNAGDITKIMFYMLGGVDMTYSKDWVVYMGHTSKTGFSSTTDWISVANMTEVFTGAISSSPAAGWYEISLDNPFSYNNTDNLVIAIDENTDDYDDDVPYCRIWTPSEGYYRTLYYYDDYTNPNPSSPPTGIRQTYMNQIQLVIETANPVEKPTDFLATTASSTQINLSWEQNGNNNDVMLVYNSTNTFGSPANGSTYTVNDVLAGGGTVIYSGSGTSFSHQSLNANTTYYYRAWSVDASDNYSNAVSSNATTSCGLYALPFSEEFDDASWPQCWTQTFSGGLSGERWEVNIGSIAGGDDNEMMCNDDDNIGISRLISPSINTTGITNLNLKFKTFYHDYGIGATLKIQSSSDGINWTDESWSILSGSGDFGSATVSVPIANNLGSTTYIAWVIDGDHFQINNWYIDDVLIYEPTDMVFVSVTTTQTNTSILSIGAVEEHIIGVEIETSGDLNPLTASSFTFNTNGTTDAGDITSAQLWYSENDNDALMSWFVGDAYLSPSGQFIINSGTDFPVTLLEGTNYFWLTFDIDANATPGHFIDAECQSVTIGGTAQTPTVQAPVGNREIKAPLSGIYTIDNTSPTGGANFNNFSDAVYNLNVLGITAPVTFNVFANQIHNVSIAEDDFSAFEITSSGSAVNPIIFQKFGSGSNPEINVTGNTLTNRCFSLYGADYITFDGITINNAGTTVDDYLNIAFTLSGSNDNNCRNIVIKNCTINLTNDINNTYGIYLYANAPTLPENANSYNSFINNTITNVSFGYYFYGSSTQPDVGNFMGIESGGSSSIEDVGSASSNTLNYGIYGSYQEDITVENTTINNMLSNRNCYGIYLQNVSGTTSINNCTIDEVNSASTNTTTGIYFQGLTGAVCNIFENNISRIIGNGHVYGVHTFGSADVNIYRNTIRDVKISGTSSYQTIGLYINGGITNNIYNNFIYDVATPAGSASPVASSGINLNGGTLNNIFHNTVYLNYVSTNTSNRSAAVYLAANALDNDFRNNIFVNTTNVATGTRAVALYKSASSLGNFSVNSNNNLFYAGTPSTKNLIYYNGSSYQTLATFKTQVSPRENLSVTEMPPFISSTLPFDLHLDELLATQTESGGMAFTSPVDVQDDYDGDVRFGKTSYAGSGLAPDIGADEFDGIMNDLTAPIISYQPLAYTSSTANRDLSNVQITDASGIDVSAGSKPRVYYKKSTQTNDITGWQYVEANNASSPFEFTFDYTLIGGASGGDVIQYFVVAQDLASTPNVAINAGTFANPQTSVNLLSNAFPIGGTLNSYTIYPTISGILTVGAVGADYTSLTNTGGLFDAINNAIVEDDITVKITSDLTENGTVALKETKEEGTGNYTITIEPADDVEKLISGSTASSGMIRFDGADRVTIRGFYTGLSSTYGKYLRFRNTHTTTITLALNNGAQNNTISDVIIESANSSGSGGAINISTLANINNTVSDCIVRNLTLGIGRPKYGIYIGGAPNDNNQILNTEIINFNEIGVYLASAQNTIIDGCELYLDVDATTSVTAIRMDYTPQTIIKNNIIKDLNGLSTSFIRGIYFLGSSGVECSAYIINNSISLSPVTTSSVYGIDYNGAYPSSLYVYYNSVYIGGSVSSGSNATAGILKQTRANQWIQKNNTIFNNRTNGGSATANHYALSIQNIQTINPSVIELDNNNYFFNASGGGKLGVWWSTYYETLIDWKGASYLDAHSLSEDPLYTSTSDLKPLAASPLKGKGIPITSITTDFEGSARHASFPTVGAYEMPINNLVVSTPAQTITSDEDYDFVIVEPNGELTLEAGNTLTVGNHFIIESDATGTGSFIQNGTLNVTGDIIVQKYLPNTTTTGWTLSSPVQDATASTFDGSDNIWHFNTTLADWEAYMGFNLESMTGYVVRYPMTKTVEFTGDLNNGTISRNDLVRNTVPNNNFGWNFVGNPYPSPIDIDANPGVTSNNLKSAIYYRMSNGNVASYVRGSGVPGANNGTNIIPSMQAFWVQVLLGQTTGSLEVTNDARLHASNNTYKTSPSDILRLSVDNGNYSDETVIRFIDMATNLMDDNYDAVKMFTYNNNIPQLFSMDGVDNYSFNSLPLLTTQVSVPMGIRTLAGGNHSIIANNVSSFDNSISIVLEDNLNNTFTDLRQQNTYTFVADAGTDNNRFVVHFNPTTTTDETALTHEMTIYSYDNALYITNVSDEQTILTVYNVLGQAIITQKLIAGALNKVNINEATGHYIVNVKGQKSSVSQKVFIK